MKFKSLFCLLAVTCVFSLGFAQCPDSVQVYVHPQVICPGEVAHLSTDSIQLHCVNVGDIICVHNEYLDTVIVTPEEWTSLGLSSTYTPLSVVFYVDETCRHGWAVKHTTNTYPKEKWTSARSPKDEILPNFSNERSALGDMDGFSNTSIVKNQPQNTGTAPYPAFANCPEPFYLPAIGQLNVLFSVKDRISNILVSFLNSVSLPNEKWWSSTENDTHNTNNTYLYAYYLDNLDNFGIVSTDKKTTAFSVLPVMNF